MANTASFKQRTVLVTGYVSQHSSITYKIHPETKSNLVCSCSAGGAGNALALEFAARGLRVFATARSEKSLSNLREKGIETFVLDVTDSASIASLKDEISKLTDGRLDMLFNNAGTSTS